MLASDINNLTFFPKGTILMYDGDGWVDDQTIAGWYACTAANAAAGLTPNLENQFIMGGGSVADIKKTGGANSKTLTSNNIPRHNHDTHTGAFSITDADVDNFSHLSIEVAHIYGASGVFTETNRYSTSRFSGGWGTQHPHRGYDTVSLSAAHSYAYGNVSGGTDAFDNRPAYYTLLYIRKCA
jgi:microcystin-dependent protein